MQTLTFFMFWKKKGGLKLKRRSSPKQMLDTLQRFAWCLILWSFSLRIGLLLYKNPYMTYVPTIIAWTFPGLTSRLTLTSHVHFSKGNNITRIVINYSILDNEYVHIVSYHCLINLCRESTIVQQQCSVFGNIVVPKKISRFAQSVYQFHRFFWKETIMFPLQLRQEGYLTCHHLWNFILQHYGLVTTYKSF